MCYSMVKATTGKSLTALQLAECLHSSSLAVSVALQQKEGTWKASCHVITLRVDINVCKAFATL